MKTIERKRYHQPVIRIIKLQPIRPLAGSPGNDGGDEASAPFNQSRSFVFEDDE